MSNASDFIIEDGVLISYHDNYGQGWDVAIPEGVTSIGRRAFQYNTSLTRISLPESLSSIEDEAFYDCRNLTSITIPDSVTSIGSLLWMRKTSQCRTQ